MEAIKCARCNAQNMTYKSILDLWLCWNCAGDIADNPRILLTVPGYSGQLTARPRKKRTAPASYINLFNA